MNSLFHDGLALTNRNDMAPLSSLALFLLTVYAMISGISLPLTNFGDSILFELMVIFTAAVDPTIFPEDYLLMSVKLLSVRSAVAQSTLAYNARHTREFPLFICVSPPMLMTVLIGASLIEYQSRAPWLKVFLGGISYIDATT